MGWILAGLRRLVELKMLIKTLWSRYFRITKSLLKLCVNSIKLITLSVNYLAAFIIIPGVLALLAFMVTREWVAPLLIGLIAALIYIVMMSNYFSKGVHKFGESARLIKQEYHTVRLEHKLALESIREDKASNLLLIFLSAIMISLIVLIFFLKFRLDMNSKLMTVFFMVVLLKGALIVIEYVISGHKLFRMEKTEKRKQEDKKEESHVDDSDIPQGFKRSESFDELIIEADPGDNMPNNDDKKDMKAISPVLHKHPQKKRRSHDGSDDGAEEE